MRIHPRLGASALAAGLLVGACDSSTTSPAPGPVKPETKPLNPSGTLTMAGKAWPVYVGGLYDKDSMLVIIKTNLDSNAYTGWLFSLKTMPGAGTRAIEKDTSLLPRNSATYQSNANKPAECVYRIDEGSFRIDSWTANSTGKYETAKMSGSATMSPTPFISTPDCEGFTAELTFTDADAGFTPAEAQ